jgi:hypothetical protein
MYADYYNDALTHLSWARILIATGEQGFEEPRHFFWYAIPLILPSVSSIGQRLTKQ